jgi:enoyl-CoA hydratase/carnithine racemase
VLHGALGAIADCRHPTVALIEGVCVGGGLEIAALCDLRICGESSRFGVPINRLGLVMAHAELAALVQLAGRAVALEMLLEGRVFGAREALDKRLVHRVVADDRVEAEALATARRIAAGAPLVARWHKQFLRQLDSGRPLTEAERDEGFRCYDTQDFRIGYRAFLAKQAPEFVGR